MQRREVEKVVFAMIGWPEVSGQSHEKVILQESESEPCRYLKTSIHSKEKKEYKNTKAKADLIYSWDSKAAFTLSDSTSLILDYFLVATLGITFCILKQSCSY